MMKFKSVLVFVFVAFLLWVLATAVLAQEEPATEVPAPYAGLKNPFPWSDTSVHEAGKGIYQRSCLSCHGASGNSVAGSDFSTTDSQQSLEEKPNFYFWVLSEGRMDKGMPSYKSSLSEEQRWQVLTYLWSLGATVSPSEVTPPPTKPPAEGVGGNLQLTAPKHAQSGQPLNLTASLRDNQGEPVRNATVKFFVKVNFFTSGLMEIGEALTNDQGVAIFEYTPRLAGDMQIIAHYGRDSHLETTTALTLTGPDEPFYQAEAGIRLPALGEEVLIFPKSALEPEYGSAPMTVYRLPGGILSWLLLLVVAVILIWGTYSLVMHQVLRIASVDDMEDTSTRLVPLIGIAAAVVLVTLLVLMLVTGPYSHLHLLR